MRSAKLSDIMTSFEVILSQKWRLIVELSHILFIPAISPSTTKLEVSFADTTSQGIG